MGKQNPPGVEQAADRLEPILRWSYDEAMAADAASWLAGEPLAIVAAVERARLYYPQAVPEWLRDAVVKLANDSRTPDRARRHRESVIHMLRYQTVCYLHADGMTLAAAFERVAQMSPTDCDAETIRASYYKVLRDLEAGRDAEYYTVKGAALTPQF